MLLVLAEAGLKLHSGKLLEKDRLRLKGKIGRPDILHTSLLNVIQTPGYLAGLVDVVVHNYDDRIIRFTRDRRMPKRYERFRGLMEQLLRIGQVPPKGRPLVWIEHRDISEILKDRYVVGLTSKGTLVDIVEYTKDVPKDTAFVIGMFPQGYFSEKIDALFDDRIAISSMPLHAWVVVARVVYAIERRFNLLRSTIFMRVIVHVKPNSSEFRVVRISDSERIVYVRSPPTKGKANEELVKELKKTLKKSVRIVSGFTSKTKILEIS